MKPFHRILFATDFTAASEPALAEAIEMARGDGTELFIAHVYSPPNVIEVQSLASGIYEEWDQSLRARVQMKLEPLVEKARKAGVKADTLILSGAPYEAITDAAKETGADLVILGTHGRTGVSKFFLASRVISSAPCPVMTVRAA
jgi:universal stress protein A